MIVETLRLAALALWAHKLRTVLTLLGLMIGIASVIAIISVLDSMMLKIDMVFENQGASTIMVTRFGIITSHEDWLKARKRKRLTPEDADALRKSVSYANEVGLEMEHGMTVKHGSNSLWGVQVMGDTPNVVMIQNIELESGRFFSDVDQEHRRHVAIIGQTIKDRLFQYENPLGKEISLRGTKYTVIGVGDKQGSVFGNDMDRYVRIPAATMMKETGRHQNVTILVKAIQPAYISPAMDQIRATLRARRGVAYHDDDDFAMLTADMLQEFFGNMTAQLRLIAVAVPAIAIVVAGIVVMNIMMVSVTERTREIGIRKAVGARRRNILMQFLLEAMLMSFLGSLLGSALGITIHSLIAEPMGVPFVISTQALIIGIIIPVSIGIFFGIYPAWKAARLDPIDALRFE